MVENDTSNPIVNPSYMNKLFMDLEKMVVELDEDPLDYSPSRMNSKIKQCRSFLDRIQVEALAASRKLHNIKEKHRAAEKLYKLDEDKLLNTDPEVRAGRSIDDRRAVARMKLPKQVAELTWMEQGIDDLQTALAWIKWKQSDLKNTQSQLKEQRNLCNEEIALGRVWRMKNLPNAPLQPGQGRKTIGQMVADETESLIAELGEGFELPANPSDEPEDSEEDSEEEDLVLVPGQTVDDPTELPNQAEEEECSEHSTNLLPVDPTEDPSEAKESEEEDIMMFLDSPDVRDPKPTDNNNAESEELDIEDLLEGLG